MIDPKRIRQNPEEFLHALGKRKLFPSVESFLQQDEKRRQLLNETEEKKALRNSISKQMGISRKKGASEQEISSIMTEMQKLNAEIGRLDAEVASIDSEMEAFLLSLPNPPYADVPERETVELRRKGEVRNFLWEPKTHQELGCDLDIITNISDSSAPVMLGSCAQLKRSIVNFFLDFFSNNHYKEISMHSDAPMLSLFRDSILSVKQFPVRLCRSNDVIELVELVSPEQSAQALDHVTNVLENAFAALKLPCRTVALRAEKLVFSAARTERIELWMPSQCAYVAAADCSNHDEFLARRMSVRCRAESKEKPRYLHTLSAVIDIHTIISAILENNQNENGSVSIPEALRSYAGFKTIGS